MKSNAKVDILLNKIVKDLEDAKAKDFAMKLTRIPKTVRHAMLKAFVNRCR